MKTMTIAILLITASNLFSQETKTATEPKVADLKAVEPKVADLKDSIKTSDVSIYNSGTFRDYVAIKSFSVENASDIPLDVEVKVTYRVGTGELGSRNLKIGILPKKSTSVFSVDSENKELILNPKHTELRTDGDVISRARAVVTVHSAVPSDCKDRAVHFTADMLATELSVEEHKVDDAWLYFVVRVNRAANSGTKVGPKDWDGTTADLGRFDREYERGTTVAATSQAISFARDYMGLARQYLGRAKPLATLHGEKANLAASKTLEIKESKLTDENADALRKAIAIHGARLAAIDGIGIKEEHVKK